MGWVSPTGHNDPDNQWNDEAKAYDEDTGTAAATDPLPYYAWTKYLELTRAAVNCNKVRFNVVLNEYITSVKVDVFYDGGWHAVYEGAVSNHVWVEKDIPAGTKSVTKARLSFWCAYSGYKACVYEFDFWEVPIVAPTVTTQAASSIEHTSAILNGTIANTGGENCDERGFEWGTSPGSYPNSWTEPGSYGTGAFSHELTGLTKGQTYYYRAKAHNSAGWGYGGEVSFTTKGETAYNTMAGSPTSWGWEKCDYG